MSRLRLILAVLALLACTGSESAATDILAIAAAPEPLDLPAPSEKLDATSADGRGNVAEEPAEDGDDDPGTNAAEEPSESPAEGGKVTDGESQLADDALTVGADTILQARWNNGLEFLSTNREFRVHVGGRGQVDTTAYTAGPGPASPPADGGLNPPLSGSTNWRRGRFRIDGQMYENYEWLAEYDFINQLTITAQSDPTLENAVGPYVVPTEVWLTITQLPIIGNVRIGNQNTMNGLEHITSDRWLNFMERSFLNDAFFSPFNNGYAPGILVFDNALEDDRLWWGLGIYKNDQNPFGFANTAAANSYQARVTGLVVDDPDNARWTHLGLCAIYQQCPKAQQNGTPGSENFQQGSFRQRIRGNLRNAPPGPLNSIYADTGLMDAGDQTLLTFEYASNWGPWQVQAEWAGSFIPEARTILNPSDNAGQQPLNTQIKNFFTQGAYCEVMYALTGESRVYNRKQAVLERYVPRNNFFRVGGPRGIQMSEGAWQIGARYDWVTLDSQGVKGGVLNGLTVGLNWMMNPNARMYFNYDFTYRDFVNSRDRNGSGGINGFGARLAFDF
jgi:phosphate-selective porin OprO/OprP